MSACVRACVRACASERASERVRECVRACVMYVCHTNQIASTINGRSNSLFLLQVNVTRYFYLLVSNGTLTLLLSTHKWFQVKLTKQ